MNAPERQPTTVPIGPLVGSVGAVLLVVSLFLDWYTDISGFTVFEFLDLLLVLLALATIASLADYVGLSTGFDGTGVRGEVMDDGVLTSHQAFASAGGVLMQTTNDPFNSHGTSTTGCVFGDGTGNPAGRGILAGADPLVLGGVFQVLWIHRPHSRLPTGSD